MKTGSLVVDPHDLNIRHLRAMVAIEDCCSITAAAYSVHLSQPALSQGVAKLEHQLGCELVERRNDGISLTPAGQLLTGRVRAATTHIDSALREIKSEWEHAARRISMAQIRAFLALNESANYAAAASLIGSSQTAVHRAVGDLEKVLDQPLIDRRGRSTLLNSDGKILARGLRLAVNEIRSLLGELRSDLTHPLIVLGSLPHSRPVILPTAIMLMLNEDSRVRFSIAEGNWQDLVEHLRNGVIDLVVGAFDETHADDLMRIPLTEDHLVVLCGTHHPLAGMVAVTKDELAKFDWIVAPQHSGMRYQWEQLFDGKHLPAAPVECTSVMLNVNLLAQSSFLMLASPRQVEASLQAGKLAQVGGPIGGSNRLVSVTCRRSWNPTSVEQRFVDLLRLATQRISG